MSDDRATITTDILFHLCTSARSPNGIKIHGKVIQYGEGEGSIAWGVDALLATSKLPDSQEHFCSFCGKTLPQHVNLLASGYV